MNEGELSEYPIAVANNDLAQQKHEHSDILPIYEEPWRQQG